MKLLIGGSPCTHWSIAQTKHRETSASGIGWELFLNYKIARDKYQPDYFLYENNKSMSAAIREQITQELGVEPVLINSALVSAQNRQRLYWVGKRESDGAYSQVPVEQPEDRGILLRDILETGVVWREKAYTLKANYHQASAVNAVDGGHFPAPMAAEPINTTADGKAQCLRATYYKDGIRNMVGNMVDRKTCVAEPVRIGTIESAAKNADFDSQQYRVYSPDGKSVTLCGQGGGVGAKTGLYAVPTRVYEATAQGYTDIQPGECVDLTMPKSKTRRGRAMREKSNCLTTSCEYYECCGTLDAPVYKVEDGYITINIGRLQRHGFDWSNEPYDTLVEKFPKCQSALKWWCNAWGDKSRFNIERNFSLKEFMTANPPWFKISDKCCEYAKKAIAHEIEKQSGAELSMVGLRQSEGGVRSVRIKSCFTPRGKQIAQFRPLFWMTDDDRSQYEAEHHIVHSDCYSVYGLSRTGCACCPFGSRFENELEVAQKYEPKLYQAVNNIFGDSYQYTRMYREFKKNRRNKEEPCREEP